MPMTAFMGVRISWLMLARNCDFAPLAASADFRAVLRLRSIARRSRNSRRISRRSSVRIQAMAELRKAVITRKASERA